jgi:hypothetical protein
MSKNRINGANIKQYFLSANFFSIKICFYAEVAFLKT